MSAAAMEIALDRVDRWTPWSEFTAGHEAIVAYSEAIGDTDPRHLSGELAPPMFAAVPILDSIIEAQRGATPLYEQNLGLHGEHDLHVHAPIQPGTTVRTRAALAGVRPTPAGVIVLIGTETEDADGRRLNEQHLGSFYRAHHFDRELGVRAPDHRLPEGVRERELSGRVVQRVAADQPVRYARASGDYGEYHLSDEVARSVGLPGVIVHGLCTMAFASRALIEVGCPGEPERLRRLAVRFSRPLLPGSELITSVWELGGEDGRLAFAFESRAGEESVLTHGRAEIST